MSIFKKAGQFFKNIFSKKKEEPVPEAAVQGTQVSRKPGLDCPRCKFRIQISIPMLLSGEPIFCTQCFLKLEVNQNESKSALQALGKLDKNMQEAEALKQQAQNPGGGPR